MMAMLAALNVLDPGEPLPATHIPEQRKWRSSHILPMGARVVFERLSCVEPPLSPEESQGGLFIRILLNDKKLLMDECHAGPGDSCPLGEFVAYVARRSAEIGDFRVKCGLEIAEQTSA